MGDELNEKRPSLLGQLSFGQLSIWALSGTYFRAVVDPTFFGKKSSNPFSRTYFFGQLDLDRNTLKVIYLPLVLQQIREPQTGHVTHLVLLIDL